MLRSCRHFLAFLVSFLLIGLPMSAVSAEKTLILPLLGAGPVEAEVEILAESLTRPVTQAQPVRAQADSLPQRQPEQFLSRHRPVPRFGSQYPTSPPISILHCSWQE